MRIRFVVSLILLAVTMSAQGTPADKTAREQLIQQVAGHEIFWHLLASVAAAEIAPSLQDDVLQRMRESDPCAQVSNDAAWDILQRTKAMLDEQFKSPQVAGPLSSSWLKSFNDAEVQELQKFFRTGLGQKLLVQAALSVEHLNDNATKLLIKDLDHLRGELTSPERIAKPAAVQSATNLRRIATAVEAYAADHGRYPAAKNLEEMKGVLVPKYARLFPAKDGWGTDFLYAVSADGQNYRIVSAGADRKFEPSSQIPQPPPRGQSGEMKLTTNPAEDIVWQNGGFLQAPRTLKE